MSKTTSPIEVVRDLLRERLGGPERSIDLQQGPARGPSQILGIMLNWSLEDVGGPEYGPSLSVQVNRWVELLQCPDHDLVAPNAWVLNVYDLDQVDSMPDEHYAFADPVSTIVLGLPEGTPEQVADRVVATFKALGIRRGES